MYEDEKESAEEYGSCCVKDQKSVVAYVMTQEGSHPYSRKENGRQHQHQGSFAYFQHGIKIGDYSGALAFLLLEMMYSIHSMMISIHSMMISAIIISMATRQRFVGSRPPIASPVKKAERAPKVKIFLMADEIGGLFWFLTRPCTPGTRICRRKQ